MEKAEYVDRIAIRAKVCTGCTMLVDGVCRDADPCEKLIAGFLEEPSADVIPAHRKEKAHNDPLTLDELRKMDGEPVFLVDLVHKSDPKVPDLWGGWIVFTKHDQNGFIPRGGGFFSNDGYGKNWLSYRQKPKEETK